MNNYMVRKTKKKTKKRKNKLKEYDLYNGKQWENYRLGDIIYGHLACWDDYCSDTMIICVLILEIQ